MISSLMLICAVMASLAFGVLVAYGLCTLMFRLFHVHALSTRRERAGIASSAQVALKS